MLGKVAFVTGASSGIGKSICGALVCHGVTVIGVARNIQEVQVIITNVCYIFQSVFRLIWRRDIKLAAQVVFF